PDSSITLYPYWTANQYTVTLKYQDGRTDDKKITVTYGSTYGSDLPSEPSRAGYHFVDWFTQEEGGDKVDSNSTVITAQDHTLFARWTDDIKPVIGELTYNYTPKIVNGWLVGKDQLVITVPVTEEGSGVSEITYTVTSDGKAAEIKKAPLTATEDAAVKKATVTVNANFKGMIRIDCQDVAGNPADSVTVGANLSGAAGFAGIIIEDNAPTVSFVINGSAVSGEAGYYEEAPDVKVTVTDDEDNAISGGIATVAYKVGNSDETPVNEDFTSAMVTTCSFTIPATDLNTGTNIITVMAADNAGNTAQYSLTVYVKGQEATPDARIDFIAETLTGLVSGAEYTVNGATKTADAAGTIPIEEDWIGADISIIKKGNKEGATFDSEAQQLSIPSRPDAPSGFTANNAAYPGAEDGSVTGLDTGYTYEISDDGGITWKDAQWNGTDIIGLLAGSYRIRIKAAADKNFKSAASETFTIGEDRLRQEDTPDAKVDCENENLTGLIPDGEYTINGETRKADKDGNIHIEEEWIGRDVDIVKKGNGTTTTDSDKQTVRIPAKEKKPNPKTADVSAKGKSDGKITNLEPNETYEISTDGGKTWETKTADGNGEITGLPAGDYKIRTKAKDNANGGTFSSDAADCKIGTKSSSKGGGGSSGSGGGNDNGGGSSGSGGDDNGGGQPNDDGGSSQTGNTPEDSVTPPTDTKNPEKKTPPTDTPKTKTPKKETSKKEDTKQDTDKEKKESKKPEQSTKPDTKPSAETADNTAPAETGNDEVKITGDIISTGTIKDAQDTTTTITVGEGSVSVTVVSDEYRYAAGVADTVAVANAVLTREQIGLVNKGEKIEVRVEVKDISEQVSKEDKDIIENGLAAESREEELTLGAYIDISMFIKIGDGDWNAITQSGEPIDVVIGIPDDLQSDGRTYYITRCHEGEYALLNDMDTEAETITIKTALFSTYAIVYSQVNTAGSKCSLCHICPTFLGICCFIWLAVITVAVIVVILIVNKRRKNEKSIY
ncbi:MAG: InlB B-repeat-containing protein, partial [Lachnospiraceae bacterium]|nr:InlB B-repeat-containing protein [Lachnospiraceae bacterium]